VITNEDFTFDLERNPVTVVAPPVSSRDIYLSEEIFTVQPNPTSGLISINSESDQLIKKVVVMSLDGKELEYVINNSGSIQVDLSGLETGVYMLKIVSDSGLASKRVIVE
jgi:hypothetical protein